MAPVNTPSVSPALVQFLSGEMTLACGQQEAVEYYAMPSELRQLSYLQLGEL